jgi:CRISPR-associated protein Cas1
MLTTVTSSRAKNNPLETLTPMPVRVPFDKIEYDNSCKQYEEATEHAPRNKDTIILGGFGASMKVEHKALVLKYDRSHSEEAKIEKLYKATHKVNQIIVCTDGGYITLDAIKWCCDENITVFLLDWRGSLVQVLSPKHPSSAKLIWQQYNATKNELALSISVELVRRKVKSQLETLALYPLPKRAWAMDILERGLQELHTIQSIEKLRKAEGTIASVYFAALTGIPIKWDTRTAKIAPPHWLTIIGRNSPLSKGHGARWSINPFHSCLNFAFALLEAQVLQAIIAAGLEPTCGYLHAYQAEKNTLCHDLMEPFRATVDAKMLSFFEKTTFSKGDFFQVFSGEVRLNEELRRYILAMCRVSQSDIDALVMWLKATLTSKKASRVLLPA